MTDFKKEENFDETTDSLNLSEPEYYEAFVKICRDSGLGPGSIPSFDQWLDLVGADDDERTKLGFTVNPGRVIATFSAFRSSLNSIGITAATQDSFINAAGSRLRQQVTNNARRTGSRMFQSFANNVNQGGGDGGTSQAGYTGGSNWNPTGLSLKNKPINVSFDADIRFIGADKYYLDGAEHNTPLLLKGGIPGLIMHGTDFHVDKALEDYFTGPITQCYQRSIAQRVTYSNAVTGQFSNERVRRYINNSLQAVCTYYFWMSVLAYTSDSRNKNGAMEVLANSLSPSEKDNLVILKKAIEQAVIPPFIHKWAFYIMGNFKQSHVPGSPMIKFFPWRFMDTTTHVFTKMATATHNGVEYGSITSATLNLNEIRDMMDVLGAAFPDWTNFVPFEYTSSPEVDMNFSNMWCNGYYKTTKKSTALGFETCVLPDIGTDREKPITWNSQTDAPKGWTQAMQAIHYTDTNGDSMIVPGFFFANVLQPDGSESFAMNNFQLDHNSSSVSCHTTCLIYDGSTAGSEGFVDVSTLARYQAIAKNTYSVTHASTSYHSHQKNGCSLIKLQTIDTIRQACFKWLDLYCQDLKDAPASTNYSKNSSKGKSKSSYSRGKSKMNEKSEEKEEMS